MEEPTLPLLSKRSERTPAETRPFKRARFSSPPALSSDPPTFSSDDDPSADNYAAGGRMKKKYKGPWYSQRPQSNHADRYTQREPHSLSKRFDSAVYIGSDVTDNDSDAEFSSRFVQPPPTVSPRKNLGRSRIILSPEEVAQKDIEKWLDQGKEEIDLSDRRLTVLSNHTIKPLSTLVVVPSGSQGCDYTELKPSLKIFLSGNHLQRIPGEICKLEDLSMLTLRNNHLVELPSAIGHMRHLVELNVSNNALHYLPYEILDLLVDSSKLRIFRHHPNPFYEPLNNSSVSEFSSSYRTTAESLAFPPPPSASHLALYASQVQDRQSLPRWNVRYRCRSKVRFLDMYGIRKSGPIFPQDHSLFRHFEDDIVHDCRIPVAPPGDVAQPPASSPSSSFAPSLFEIAVRAWSVSTDQPELKAWLNSDDDVTRLTSIMRDAKVLRESEAGDRKCTVCHRTFVIPRAEWIEWWEIGSHEKRLQNQAEELVPLIRRSCSWRCVPAKVVLEQDGVSMSAN